MRSIKTINRMHTDNEALIMMYRNTSGSFTKVADLIEKEDMNKEEIVTYIRKCADELNAQISVIKVREMLK